MPLETITYISDLVASNPTTSDGLVEGDDHLRGIKGALKNTFAAFTGAAVSATEAEVNAVAHTGQISAQNGSSGAPSITFKTDATAGLYKGARTGQTAIAGTLRGAGSFPVGGIVDFPKSPPGLNTEWIECDGSLRLIATFPDLYAFLGTTFGGDGVTTFGIPNLIDTGRFRRSRTASVGAGTYQSNSLGSHFHNGTVDSAGSHTHTATVSDPGHQHVVGATVWKVGGGTGINGTAGVTATADNPSTTAAFTGISVSNSVDGAHTHTFTTSAAGGAQTQPESFVVVTCIKT